MKPGLKKLFFISALVLLFGQFSNQVFCGDIDCLQGGSSENCATLLCSLLGSHTNTPAQSSDQDQGQDCHCVCHLQFNHSDIDLFALQLIATGQIVLEPTIYTNFIFHRIYHPPAA